MHASMYVRCVCVVCGIGAYNIMCVCVVKINNNSIWPQFEANNHFFASDVEKGDSLETNRIKHA